MSNRVIKFRVWFHEPSDISLGGEIVSGEYAMREDYIDMTSEGLAGTDECSIIMQFTGLHDKNGVEIYEGDIVSFDVRQGEGKCELPVRFCRGKVEISTTGVSFGKWCYEYCEDVRVIGNIYENPGLLESSYE